MLIVDIQVNTRTTEFLETTHTIPSLAYLPALIEPELSKHKDVTSITVVVVFNG